MESRIKLREGSWWTFWWMVAGLSVGIVVGIYLADILSPYEILPLLK